MGKRRITISDVAASAGVSMMTVSRAVNGRDGITEETRQRILKIASEMGYRPNHIARGLVTHQTATLGLIMPDVSNPFFSQIARSAEEIAYKNDYNLFLMNTGEDAEREKGAINSLINKEIDGVLVCSSRLTEKEIIPLLDMLPAAVLVNRDLDLPGMRVASLTVNDSQGTQIAMKYLIERGHKKIALLTGPKSSFSGQQRMEGYQTGLRQYGLPFVMTLVGLCAPTTQGGETATLELFEKAPDIDAVIAFNDLVAVGVIRACQQAGRKVPEDVAVIGADDIPLSALTSPSLSTLHVDLSAIGERAMLALLRLIDSPQEEPQKIVFEPELVLRQST
jgi:LacI family transcriptional regulator